MPDAPAGLADRYDAAIAERMIVATDAMNGIPQLTGLRILRFGPGRLWAQAHLGDSLITPSGNVHGGALAAVLDHVSGAVVYPLIPDGWWGATLELKAQLRGPGPSWADHRRGDGHRDWQPVRRSARRGVPRRDAGLRSQSTIALVAPRI